MIPKDKTIRFTLNSRARRHSSAATQSLSPAAVKSNMSLKVLSNDVASESEITPCNKIDKPLVVYRFSGNIMTYITTLLYT